MGVRLFNKISHVSIFCYFPETVASSRDAFCYLPCLLRVFYSSFRLCEYNFEKALGGKMPHRLMGSATLTGIFDS